MAVKYTFRYRKIIAEADEITVNALLRHIKGRCHSPMDIDNRKGAIIHWKEFEGTHDHPDLPLKQDDYDSYHQWTEELREKNKQILPILCFSRHEPDRIIKRYCVSGSRSSYNNEEDEFVGIWLPTKAYKANTMCYLSSSKPLNSLEKKEDLTHQVNGFLDNYSDWVNGENYALTVTANEKGKDEKTLIQNMFLGSGYNLCSEIAKSHITVILRKMDKAKRYTPDVDLVDALSMDDESILTFFDSSH
jgi:hypothetical protein